MTLSHFLPSFLFIVSMHAQAQQADMVDGELLEQKISNAISAFEQTKRRHWSYQISRYENEEGDITSSVEQFNAASPAVNKWTLLEINGALPTQKQKAKFHEQKTAQAAKKRKGSNYSFKLREIIQSDSLTLTKEDDQYLYASFNVYLDKLGKEAKDKLRGKLLYHKDKDFIEKITIVNKAPFSPVFSANIEDLTLTFQFIEKNGQILPVKHELAMQGNFAFFTEIDEVSTDTYSHYQYVGDTVESELNVNSHNAH